MNGEQKRQPSGKLQRLSDDEYAELQMQAQRDLDESRELRRQDEALAKQDGLPALKRLFKMANHKGPATDQSRIIRNLLIACYGDGMFDLHTLCRLQRDLRLDALAVIAFNATRNGPDYINDGESIIQRWIEYRGH